MAKKFIVGNYVAWRLDAGHGLGKIIKVHTRDVNFNGTTFHASSDDPQYEIRCGKGNHRVMQKGVALIRAKELGMLPGRRIDMRR